ncbi:hypothetical protein D3C85_1637170 [compost metagenome]
MQLGQALVRQFLLAQETRDHADHAAAGGQRRIRGDAHQADIAAAVHQGDVTLRQRPAKLARRLLVSGTRALVGTTKQANRLDSHGRSSISGRHNAGLAIFQRTACG